MASVIQGPRLDLIPLTPELLRASLARDSRLVAERLGLSVPELWPEIPDVLERRLRQLEAEPALQPWLLRAMVQRDRRVMVGHIGFHAGPGAEYLRPWSPGVELGYTVFPAHRRRGYAAEACAALMAWAHREHGITRFVASIRPDNAPSQALAHKLGFRRIGSHIDDLDGPEDILERRIEDQQRQR